MFYAAVFQNGQVSPTYSSKAILELHNVFRMNQIHSIVHATNKEGLDDEIKASLRTLRKV